MGITPLKTHNNKTSTLILNLEGQGLDLGGAIFLLWVLSLCVLDLLFSFLIFSRLRLVFNYMQKLKKINDFML